MDKTTSIHISWLKLNKTTLRAYSMIGVILYCLALVQFVSPISHELSFFALVGPFIAFVWWFVFMVLFHFFHHKRKVFYALLFLLILYVWGCWGVANLTSCAHNLCQNKSEAEVTGMVVSNFLTSLVVMFPLILLIPGGLLVRPKVMY